MTDLTAEWCLRIAKAHETPLVGEAPPDDIDRWIAAALRIAARVLADDAEERVAREIMINRTDHPGCAVKDWTAEARDNPHVEQAVNQAQAVLTYLRGASQDHAPPPPGGEG